MRRRLTSSNDISYLASPVTGAGVIVGRFQQLFLLALQQGKKTRRLGGVRRKILVAQGQKIVKEGKALETQQEHLAELTSQANDFSMKQLPILKALQVARDS